MLTKPSRVLALSALLASAACDANPTEPRPTAVRGLLVLHAVGAVKGLTVNDTAAPGARIALPAEYDGADMRYEADTALTTSSSFGTNKLHIASLATGSVRDVEMPINANAAGAVRARGFRDARVAVALRGTPGVALVAFDASGAATTRLLDAVGRCPTDVGMHGDALWVLDQNAACDRDFAALGDSRLIRVGPSGAARDTLPLPSVCNAVRVIVDGDRAYVAAIGSADYSAFPTVRFVAPGSVTVVDLRTRRVVGTLSLPMGTNGAAMTLGADGRLYVTAYLSTAFDQGTFAVDPATLAFVGPRAPGAQSLRLMSTMGERVGCAAATADARGRLYCAVNQGALLTTSIVVFDLATGSELRRFTTAGTGAVDVALR